MTRKTALRRRFQFTIRAFLRAVAAVCVLTAFCSQPTQSQRLAHDVATMGGIFDAEPVGPECLRRMFGVVAERPMVRCGPSPLGPFDRLTSISLGLRRGVIWFGAAPSPTPSRVRDWLEGLDGLTSLRELNLSYAPVSESAIRELRRLPNLATLRLSGLPVTDQTVEHLAQFTSLELLELNSTNITDRSVPHFAHLVNLRLLYVSNTKITDGGVTRLNRMLVSCDVVRH